MFYVGLYQIRAIQALWCPLARGCETVADAPFARPFGIPDGWIAFALYLAIAALLSLQVEGLWLWSALLALAVLAVAANILGVHDMYRLGAYCTYCLLTTFLSPLLLYAIWRLR